MYHFFHADEWCRIVYHLRRNLFKTTPDVIAETYDALFDSEYGLTFPRQNELKNLKELKLIKRPTA